MQSLGVRIVIGAVCILLILIVAALAWPEKSYVPFEPDEDYLRQADAYPIPPMPAGWEDNRFRSGDGTELRWGQVRPDVANGQPRATVLIVPGYTATLTMYGEQMQWLLDRNYHVMGVDLRGQGLSERYREDQPEKLWVDDFSIYSNDLADFVQSVKPDGRPLIVIGNSFGGHVALRMAVDHADVADGLFLIAPAVKPKAGDMGYETAYRIMSMARLFGKAKRYVVGSDNWRPAHSDLSVAAIEYCASNPDRLHARDVIFTRYPSERVGGPTNQWAAEFYESSLYLLNGPRLEQTDVPTVMVQAEIDTFVENDAIEQSCDRMPNCNVEMIPQTGHCLFQESDAVIDTIFDRLDRYVTAMLGPEGQPANGVLPVEE